ncbi:MAG TPA: fructose-bisphosphatase class II [Verrucomicrobiae bacterium]|nr:fructose-bisphosphatase class II [Verrucomicrobiae bacterium]
MSIFQAATIAAAMRAVFALGRGDKMLIDQLGTDGMRGVLDRCPLLLRIAIGEGDLDEAPGFKLDEELGGTAVGVRCELPHVLVAVDPIDGTQLAAKNKPGAIAVLAGAISGEGTLWRAPECYAEKRCVGPELAHALKEAAEGGKKFTYGDWTLDPALPLIGQPMEALILFAREKLKKVIVVEYLDRERNQYIVDAIRRTGAIASPIDAGDIGSAVRVVQPHHNVDIAAGSGGGPEGVIAAVIAKCSGGYFEQRPYFSDSEEDRCLRQSLIDAGIDPDKTYVMEELAGGHVFFSCTALTHAFIPGVNFTNHDAMKTNTIIGRSRTGTHYDIAGAHGKPPPQPEIP